MVGVVIPSFNEHEGIAQLITALIKLIPPSGAIVVVDDSPSNRTVEVVQALRSGQVHLIHRQTKGGRGSAVIEGIRKCLELGCNQIVEMDADFSHPPTELPTLLSEARERQLDLLIGSRYLEKSQIINWPLSRRVFSRCSNWLARLVLQVPIHDYTNGYRCYSRRAAEQIAATCGKLGKGFIALSEILVNLYFRGYSVGERPTIFVNRVRGESSVNAGEISGALIGLFRIYGLKKELQAAHGKLAIRN